MRKTCGHLYKGDARWYCALCAAKSPMLIVVGAPNLPSPPRSDALQPSEKETHEDARFSRFLAREESPQWNALRGLMQQATTLVAFRRLAADPEAMRTAEALRTRATTEPKMLSVLSDQARRIRADPQLMDMMSAMQRVLADPRAPLPSAAGDGLPMPKMDLAELLAQDGAQHVGGTPQRARRRAGSGPRMAGGEHATRVGAKVAAASWAGPGGTERGRRERPRF